MPSQTLLTRALATGLILILALVREPGGCYSGGSRSERDPPSRKNCGNKKLKTPFRTLSETEISPSLGLSASPTGCRSPLNGPLILARGGTSPLSVIFHTPTKPKFGLSQGSSGT